MEQTQQSIKGGLTVIQSDPSDIFLTGNPTITYFKTIYRRYTNFSLEIKELPFNNNVGFGLTSDIKILKIADLIHRMYLKITIPEFYINKPLDINKIEELQEKYNLAISNYNFIKNFFIYNFNAYREISALYKTNDENIISYINIINREFDDFNTLTNSTEIPPETKLLEIITNFNNYLIENDIKNIRHIIGNIPIENIKNFGYKYDVDGGNINLSALESYLISISNNNLDLITKDIAMSRINYYISMCKHLDKDYMDYINSIKTELEMYNNQYYKFAWVNKLGHSIIDYIEFYIGGVQIDKQYGQWMDIWYEISGDKRKFNNYMELIGDVPELTTFDATIKPRYTMHIPLHFWFCKNPALALPLLSLQYNDIIVKVKLRKFSECAYTDFQYVKSNLVNFVDIINQNDLLDNIMISKELNLEASLMVEFVYLDSQERKLFARSSHEYLIEQTQIQVVNNLVNNKYSQTLNFMHPCKGYIWFAQPEENLLNLDNTNKCKWTDYSVVNSEGMKVNPFTKMDIQIEGRGLSQQLNGIYYNYVQPYQYFKNSPSIGINSYWFSLYPMEFQPSGFCNMSYVRELRLNYEFDSTLEKLNKSYRLVIFALNYNILRISGGFGNLAYV